MSEKFAGGNPADGQYWENRYRAGETGWDLGAASPPLKAYFDQLTNKGLKILVPGAGNGYEAAYLWDKGFKNVYVLDFAPSALENFRQHCPGFPESQLIAADFFGFQGGGFDLVVEQTFFCALPPTRRQDYFNKMHNLLNNNGKLVGLLFATVMDREGPPFGGTAPEYLGYMEGLFKPSAIGICYNSIKPRQGNELFMILVKITQPTPP